jgi:hypothetical protein
MVTRIWTEGARSGNIVLQKVSLPHKARASLQGRPYMRRGVVKQISADCTAEKLDVLAPKTETVQISTSQGTSADAHPRRPYRYLNATPSKGDDNLTTYHALDQ